MARGVSTVLDVAVCLLLITAAVATLTVDFPDSTPDPTPNADEIAGVLATSTTAVHADDRVTHRTAFGHLAAAAVTNATVGDDALAASSDPSEVQADVENDLEDRTAVTATWQPYPNASIAGDVAVGEPPPPDAAVGSTATTVDIGLQPVTGDGFECLSRSLADAVIAWLFPPSQLRPALVDGRTADETAERYRRTATTVDASVEEELTEANPHAINDELSSALAPKLEAELRDEFDTPESAAEHISTEVEIVVRRWVP